MPFQSCPNMVAAAIEANGTGKQIANVLHFLHTGAYNQVALDNLASFLDTEVGTNYLPVVSSSVAYERVHVRGLTDIIDIESVDNAHAGPGTAAGVPAPNNTSNCITLRTGHTGRSARGRFYAFPTSASNIVSPVNFVHAYTAFLVTFLESVRINCGAIGWQLVILSRRNAGVLRPLGVGTPVAFAEGRNDEIDSQRGRLLPNH